MDTDKLRYFCTIVELGSLTKASELLGVSHSGLSKAVSALESEIGVKLFIAQGRGLAVTKEGRAVFEQSVAILQLMSALKSKNVGAPICIKVGLSEVFSIYCSGIIADAINAEMTLMSIGFNEVEEKILSNELDFGVSFFPSPKVDIEYLKIGDLGFSAYARRDFNAQFQGLDIPFVVPKTELPLNSLNHKYRDGWPLNVSRVAKYYANSISIAIDMAKQGKAAAYIPDFVANAENLKTSNERSLVRIHQLEKHASRRSVFLLKNKLSQESAEMKKVAKVIRKFCL